MPSKQLSNRQPPQPHRPKGRVVERRWRDCLFTLLLSVSVAVVSIAVSYYAGNYIHSYREYNQQSSERKANIDGPRLSEPYVPWSYTEERSGPARCDIPIVDVKTLSAAQYNDLVLSSDPILLRNAMTGWRAMSRWSLPVQTCSYPTTTTSLMDTFSLY
jgi:hypothetical protein